jgi:RNA polymerase sigma factor (sigma-70 family)
LLNYFRPQPIAKTNVFPEAPNPVIIFNLFLILKEGRTNSTTTMTAPSAIHITSSQLTWLAAMQWVQAHAQVVRWEAAPFVSYMAGDEDDLFQEATIAAFKALMKVQNHDPQKMITYFRTIFRTHCLKMAVGIRPALFGYEYLVCTASREEEEYLPEPQPEEIEQSMQRVEDRDRQICWWILEQPFPVSTEETACHFNLSQRQVCRIVQRTIDHIIQQQRNMQPKLPTITEFSRKSPLPRKILLLLKRKEIIQDPLTQENQIGLRVLEQVWGDRNVLRPQISRMSRLAREKFIRTVALSSKWERYAYSRYFNQEPGNRLSLQQVIEEIQATFRFELTKKQVCRIRNIRSKAQVARYRDMRKKALEISYIAPTKK